MVCCGQALPDTQTTPPPPVGACCLRTRYTCDCIAEVSTWVLDVATTACVANSECGAGVSCSNTEFVSEVIDGCVCADPLPALPVPTCAPLCCATIITTTSTTTTTTTSTTTSTTTTTTTTTAPGCTAWSIPEEAYFADFTQTFDIGGSCSPSDACEGELTVLVLGAGNLMTEAGVVVTITLDGGVPFVSGCWVFDGIVLPIPAGTAQIEVSGVFGCNDPAGTALVSITGTSY